MIDIDLKIKGKRIIMMVLTDLGLDLFGIDAKFLVLLTASKELA